MADSTQSEGRPEQSAAPFSLDEIGLDLADDKDFDWLLGEAEAPRGYADAADIAPREVIQLIRGFPLSWLIVERKIVIGIISVIKPPEGDEAEIGYGVAASHCGQGVATRALTLLLPLLAERGLTRIVAGTAITNPASQRVLERNGFARCGERDDPEDGPLILWRRDLA